MQPAAKEAEGVEEPGRPIIPGVSVYVHNRVSINVSGTFVSLAPVIYSESQSPPE